MATYHWHPQYSPFGHDGVLGELVSLDGTSVERFGPNDVAEIIIQRCNGNQWDGDATFVLRLQDGRFVGFALTYEGGWGNDFSNIDGKSRGIVYVARDIRPITERLEGKRVRGELRG